jgi:2-dehydropantoate 2-reductase
MKIGIIGAGAMGSIFAFFFKRMNIETVLFEKNPEILASYQKRVEIIIDDRVHEFNFDISDNPQILSNCDIIFIFVKSYHTEEAVKQIHKYINTNCIITTLQNGLGNKEKISKYIQADNIVYGSTSIGATKLDNNKIRFGGMGNITIGGQDSEAVKTVKNALELASLNTTVTENPDLAVWKKAIINAGINPIGALLEIPNGRILSNEFTSRIQDRIIKEAVMTAISLGLNLDQEEMVKETRDVCRKTEKNLCSMLQDVLAKRKTEIDSINGIIIEYAKMNLVAVPYNEVVYNLVKAKEL